MSQKQNDILIWTRLALLFVFAMACVLWVNYGDVWGLWLTLAMAATQFWLEREMSHPPKNDVEPVTLDHLTLIALSDTMITSNQSMDEWSKQMTNAHELKATLIDTRKRMFQGQATEQDFNAAADAYIECLRQYKSANPKAKKLPIPTRAQLLRISF